MLGIRGTRHLRVIRTPRSMLSLVGSRLCAPFLSRPRCRLWRNRTWLSKRRSISFAPHKERIGRPVTSEYGESDSLRCSCCGVTQQQLSLLPAKVAERCSVLLANPENKKKKKKEQKIRSIPTGVQPAPNRASAGTYQWGSPCHSCKRMCIRTRQG